MLQIIYINLDANMNQSIGTVTHYQLLLPGAEGLVPSLPEILPFNLDFINFTNTQDTTTQSSQRDGGGGDRERGGVEEEDNEGRGGGLEYLMRRARKLDKPATQTPPPWHSQPSVVTWVVCLKDVKSCESLQLPAGPASQVSDFSEGLLEKQTDLTSSMSTQTASVMSWAKNLSLLALPLTHGLQTLAATGRDINICNIIDTQFALHFTLMYLADFEKFLHSPRGERCTRAQAR